MPIFMDVHNVPGIQAYDAAAAHQQDVLIQEDYQCKCMTYWVDVTREVVFCLIEAPDKETVNRMHAAAHGLIPNRIIEVDNMLVESFLGRVLDPEEVTISEHGLKVFSSSAYRAILVTDTPDPVLMRHRLGVVEADQLCKHLSDVIRQTLVAYGGHEVEHSASHFIVSFSSAVQAVCCALDVHEKCPPEWKRMGFKIAVHGGEPVAQSDHLFGDTLQLAKHLSTLCTRRIVLSSEIKDLLAGDFLRTNQNRFLVLSSADERLLMSVFSVLEENGQDTGFGMNEFCKALSMSQSQLYRKTISMWNLSPNQLLKEFKLDKARRLLKKNGVSISEITFESGFSSPSYFTKCFKHKYSLLPAAYVNALND